MFLNKRLFENKTFKKVHCPSPLADPLSKIAGFSQPEPLACGVNPFVPHPKFVTTLSVVTGLWTVRVKLYRIVLRTRIHASFPVVAARKVQTPFRIELGYARFLNSCSFVLALCTIKSVVLAILSTFLRHAVSVARFCITEPWLWKWLYLHTFVPFSLSSLSQCSISFPRIAKRVYKNVPSLPSSREKV